ncbi:hypothetical protein Q5752_003613 [Cryptotrichosporon argae]
MFEPSRTGAHLSRRSGGVIATGYIVAYRPGASTPFGYVEFDTNNAVTIGIDASEVQAFTYTVGGTASQMQFDTGSVTYYLSAVSDPGDHSAGSGNYATFEGGSISDGGQADGTDTFQTSVWNIGSTAPYALTDTYVNPTTATESTTQLKFWYNANVQDGYIIMAATVDDANSAGAYVAGDEVLFYIVSSPGG